MAGSYPDQPSRRMATDDDGTVSFGNKDEAGGASSSPGRGQITDGRIVTELLSTEQADINSDDDDGYGDTYATVKYPINYVYHFFPEKREIDGYYWNIAASLVNSWRYLSISTDTTNGVDGSYAALGSEILATGFVKPDYRNNIQTAADSNVISVLSQYGGYTGTSVRTVTLRAFHLYGTITPGETPDRIIFLDAENSDIVFEKPLDYGNIGRGSSNVRKIKVKNNSATLTANTVQVTAEALVTGSSVFTYSTDGINDVGTKSLGNIGPGGTQDVYIHMNIPDAFTLDLYEVRTSVTVASWT